MSQHDYVIDNAGGAAVRADINLVLQAILSGNSGASAPSTTKPFMLWYDTTANRLRMRNAGDTAWVPFMGTAAGLIAPIGPVLFPGTNLTLTADENNALVQCGTSGITVTTPAAGAALRYLVVNASAGQITVSSGGGNFWSAGTSVGTSLTLPSGASVEIASDGSTWFVVGGTWPMLGGCQFHTNVIGSRAAGTTYTNSTGRPIQVVISGVTTSGAGTASISVAGVSYQFAGGSGNGIQMQSCNVIVPPGHSYIVSTSNFTINYWNELR